MADTERDKQRYRNYWKHCVVEKLDSQDNDKDNRGFASIYFQLRGPKRGKWACVRGGNEDQETSNVKCLLGFLGRTDNE